MSHALDEAYRALNPDQPLVKGEADPRYVDFSPARGGEAGDIVKVIARRIRRAELAEKQIVTGHRGCGKSTELHRLQAHLAEMGYFVVYIDVETGLDLNDADYPEVFLTVAKEVVRQTHEVAKAEMDARLLEEVLQWFSATIETHSRSTTKEAKAGVQAQAGAQYVFGAIVKVLAEFQASIRSSRETRVEIRRELMREGSILIDRVNDLVRDADAKVRKTHPGGLVLILDGLEKLIFRDEEGVNTHEMLFVHHGEQLKAIACHTVYTMPISLLSSRNIGQIFTQPSVIPMVKIKEESGDPCRVGHELLCKAIMDRLPNADVLVAPDILETFVEASGGHLRDLLRLVRYAIDLTEERIEAGHAERAVNKLADEYDRLIRDEDLPCLVQIHQSHNVPGTEQANLLLFNLLVLEYQNGNRWGDVHPSVQRTRKFENARKQGEKRGGSSGRAAK